MSSDDQQFREVARRVFASEFNDIGHFFKESDDDMAPNYALLPSGQRMNRTFLVGTITETTNVGGDEEYWQARVVDPTGVFFIYAGQYQPEAMAFLRSVECPAFVSVTGKPRSYETDSGGTNITVRPEHIAIVDADTKQQWIVETARQTLARIEAFETSDTDDPDVNLAREQYTDLDVPAYREDVQAALESVQN